MHKQNKIIPLTYLIYKNYHKIDNKLKRNARNYKHLEEIITI